MKWLGLEVPGSDSQGRKEGAESPLGTEWRDVDSLKATGGRDADPFGTAERRERERSFRR